MPKKIKKPNGEGSMYYDSHNNRWAYRFTTYDNVDNKSIRKTVYGKTQQEAKERFIDIMYRTNNKTYITRHSIPLIDVIKTILERKYASNVISGGHYRRLNFTIRPIESSKIGKMNIKQITSDDIQDFLNAQASIYRNSSIRKFYEQLNQAFKFALKNKYIKENPLEDVIKPKSRIPNHNVRAFTVEEQQAFAKYLFNSTLDTEKYKNVFLLQLYLGLRVSEALALTSKDINLKHNTAIINKTLTIDKDGKIIMGDSTKTYAGKRVLPIPDFIVPILEEQIETSKENQDNLLFTYDNHYVHNHSINTQFHRILKNLAINKEGLSSHSLRHSYGTRCIEAGMPAVVLQKLMGHTDVKITLNTYTSVFNRFKQEEIEKVNDYYRNNKLNNTNDNFER